jgi:hypothetical protein
MRYALLGLLAMSCSSNSYTEGLLKLHWKPPTGVQLESEATEGAVTTAHFSGGVDVLSVAATAPETTGDLDALRAAIVASSKIALNGQVRTQRSGSIAAGPTARWELESGGQRSILYYVPGKDRYVLIALRAPSAGFDHRSDKLELSLSSLTLR